MSVDLAVLEMWPLTVVWVLARWYWLRPLLARWVLLVLGWRALLGIEPSVRGRRLPALLVALAPVWIRRRVG
jgi:hypothetical protein